MATQAHLNMLADPEHAGAFATAALLRRASEEDDAPIEMARAAYVRIMASELEFETDNVPEVSDAALEALMERCLGELESAAVPASSVLKKAAVTPSEETHPPMKRAKTTGSNWTPT